MYKFLNIINVICHHVRFHEQISKMVPANFSLDFQGKGQRSKITVLEHMVPIIMS